MKAKNLMAAGIFLVLVIFAVILGMFLGTRLLNTQSPSDEPEDTGKPYINGVANVTMIQLIATPEKYDGQLVRVIGVGNLEFEGDCISLSKEDWKYGGGNTIWIELGKEATPYQEAQQYNGEYVIVEGTFDKDDCGHLGMFCGSIKNVYRYDLWDIYRYKETELTIHFPSTEDPVALPQE